MLAIAVYDLRLTEAQFWRLTPCKFWALVAGRDEERDLFDLRAGVIAAVIANGNRGKNTKAYTAKDFFPGLAKYEGGQSELQTLAKFVDLELKQKVARVRSGG